MGDEYAYLRRRGLTHAEIARGHNEGVSSEQQESGGSDRPVDVVAGEGSFSDALRRAREAKEQGDLRRAQRIMREYREGDD